MSPLPEADASTRAEFLRWLDVFSGHVREVDYASARPLFHPEVLAFGTHRDIVSGLDSWTATQWNNVWPRTSDFRFDLDAARILVSDDASAATVIVPWTSTDYARDGSTFDRPGRATMIFHKSEGRWLCLHSHMSLNRGVPQESFADRPRKT